MLIKTEKLYRNTLLNIQKYIFISTKKTHIYKLTIRVIQRYILDIIDIRKQIQTKSHPHTYTNDHEVHEGSRKTKDKHLNLE